MSAPGRPRGEFRSAQHEGTPVSTGLLRGLAARALGLDAPLRSQRARGLDLPSSRPGPDVELAPLQPAAALWPTPLAQDPLVPWPAGPDIATPRPSAAAPGDAAVSATPVGPADDAVSSRVSSRPRAESVEPVEPKRAPDERRPAVVMNSAATPVPPRFEAPAAPASEAAAVATPQVQAVRSATPEPLLPLSAPSWPPPAAAQASTPMRRGPSSRTASAEAPTEVHVSIGRVELTALAPATSSRTPARREAPSGRSLADYLRGPGGKRPA